MLHTNRCPRCSARSPANGRCAGCGAIAESSRSSRRPGLWLVGVVSVALLLGALAASLSDRLGPTLDAWYGEALINRLPDSAFRLAPIGEDDRAFFICARAAVRRIGSESSIVTFASRETATTDLLDDGRLRIRAYLEESYDAASTQNHLVTCTLTPRGEDWAVAEIEVESVDAPPILPVATAR